MIPFSFVLCGAGAILVIVGGFLLFSLKNDLDHREEDHSWLIWISDFWLIAICYHLIVGFCKGLSDCLFDRGSDRVWPTVMFLAGLALVGLGIATS